MHLRSCSSSICRRRVLKQTLVLLIVGTLLIGFHPAFEVLTKLFRLISLTIDVISNKLHLVSVETLALNKCPACFGVNSTLCHKIKHGIIQVRRNYLWSEEAEKNVMHGIWDNKPVVIKSLGQTVEYEAFDRKICESAGLLHPCEVQSAIWRSFLNSASPLERAIKDILDCPSDRYIKKVKAKYGVGSRDVLLVYEKFFLMNTLKFNQEPLLLQVFRSEEGWPFPKYYGACGRVIIAEDVGRSLEHFLSHPWTVRAQLAVSLLKLAQQLTTNDQGWGIYMLDASFTNFAVSGDGNVKLVDVEHVIVVDLANLRATVSRPTVPLTDDCEPNKPDCLTFSAEELCQGSVRDLNYLAVCKGVLADYPQRQGLLHSTPTRGGLSVQVTAAVENCLKAKSTNRETAVKKLVTLLSSHSVTLGSNEQQSWRRNE